MASVQRFLIFLISLTLTNVQNGAGQSSATFNMEAVFNSNSGVQKCKDQYAECMACAQDNILECERPICVRDETFQLHCESTMIRCNFGCSRFETIEVPVSTGPLKFEFVSAQQTQFTTESECLSEYQTCLDGACTAAYEKCAPCRPEYCASDDELGNVYAPDLEVFDMNIILSKCSSDVSWCRTKRYGTSTSVDVSNFVSDAILTRFLQIGFNALIAEINTLGANQFLSNYWFSFCDAYPSAYLFSDCELTGASGTGACVDGEACRWQCGRREQNCLYVDFPKGGVGEPTRTDYRVCNQCPHTCTYYQDYSDKSFSLNLKPTAAFPLIRGETLANCVWYDNTYSQCYQMKFNCQYVDNNDPTT